MKTFHLATFAAEVTPPLGHPLLAGLVAPAQKIEEPLFVHGCVLMGDGAPLVLASVDWCEIRNDAYDRWRGALAGAAHTVPERVLLSSVHQHDAPLADLTAQHILEKHKASAKIIDLEFHERTVQRAARALADSLKNPRTVTHYGIGQAKIEKLASNRRAVDAAGKVFSFSRTSATRDPAVRDAPEGTIDPWLRTLSFWDGMKPLAALHFYAIHPMSYYGKGGVTSDFPGLARKRRQADDPAITQIYFSGCSGNVTAGKYNDGSADNRPVLADRLYQGMAAAWKTTSRHALEKLGYRKTLMRLEPRDGPGFTVADLQMQLKSDNPRRQALAALGLSWRQRADKRHKIEVPALDLGRAQVVLMPAESYVEFQLMAQEMRPDSFVCVAGYGECAPGYIPIERAVKENDGNLRDWCWVAPGAEAPMRSAMLEVLAKKR